MSRTPYTLRRFLLLPALLSALLLLVGPAQAQSMNARNLLKLARSAADSKDWTKAKDYANKALQEEAGYLDAYYMRAFANRELGDKKKAEEDFREVIRRDPTFLPTYGALADMYISDKAWDKAEKVFNELGQQNDGAKWASYYRGVVAYVRGDLKKAESQWKEALAKDVNFAMAQHNLGAIALAKKDYTRALGDFREALEQKPESAMYRFHVAWALDKVGQTAKAQEMLKTVMNENSDDQTFWLLARALDLQTRGQSEGSLKVLDTLCKDAPDTLDVWVLRARAALATGKIEVARESLKKAKEIDGQFVEVDDLMAKLPKEAVAPAIPPAAPGVAPGVSPTATPATTATPPAPKPPGQPDPTSSPTPSGSPKQAPVREVKPS